MNHVGKVLYSVQAVRHVHQFGPHVVDKGPQQLPLMLPVRTAAVKDLRAAGPGGLLVSAEDLDQPPTRHRHSTLWEY